MMKGSVCAIAAALLVTTGGVQEAQGAVLPVYVSRIDCETAEQWKGKLEHVNIECDRIWELLSQIGCGVAPELPGQPEENIPGQPEEPGEELPGQPEEPDVELPEEPGEELPEQPGTPDADVPVIPDVPEVPEEEPEVQDQAYVYGLRITELVNRHRAEAGLAPVEYSAELSKAAQTRAFEIEKSFSHTRPDGRHFTTALKDFGISYRYAGENIAWGQKSPEEVVTAWMNSAGHRANILNAQFTKLGVGYQQNARGVNYFTQLFTN